MSISEADKSSKEDKETNDERTPASQEQISAASVAVSADLAGLEAKDKEMTHKMKVIQFLGRDVPIILQNDNGPCPLLAICNVLSMKNSLSLNSDALEVSQEKLLSLVAERLIDSNMSTNNNDNSYAENQQQNIADAIDLLPRLATGIDVNIKFRRIDDFEFTPECAIFDLLDIPLYHGWIVDPQDSETAGAVGSKSYNSLMGELVSLDTQSSVDFVAATTAALGVPSPNLSRVQSFDGSLSVARIGDAEEAEDLLRVLKLSEKETSGTAVHAVVNDAYPSESQNVKESHALMDLENVRNDDTSEALKNLKLACNDSETLVKSEADFKPTVVLSEVDISSLSKKDSGSCIEHAYEAPGKSRDSVDASEKKTEGYTVQCVSNRKEKTALDHSHMAMSNEDFQNTLTTGLDGDETKPEGSVIDDETKPNGSGIGDDETKCEGSVTDGKDSPISLDEADRLSASHKGQADDPGIMSSGLDINEPIYEGEERILESGGVIYESCEPIYEGEVVLGQVDKGHMEDNYAKSVEKISVKEGDVIRTFIKNSASQLTVYGLFCLQEKVKERELCVFFRNNHFSTMFKYNGELYILATDQGYINQPDLVWEKLNEVNGDTVFVTGNFEEFKMNEHSTGTWDEQNVMANTAEYLAKIESTQANSSFNSDLQLAIALQQQEFDQQQEQQPQRNPQPPVSIGGSRLVTGPQVSRGGGKAATPSSSKSKEKCIVM